MGATLPITLFHNPNCGTSRTVLATIRRAGFTPEVVEYLRTGWSRDLLAGLLAGIGSGARGLLRAKEPLAAALGLLSDTATEQRLIEAMLAHPVLVERPIVRSPLGTVLARPAERVWEVLPRSGA